MLRPALLILLALAVRLAFAPIPASATPGMLNAQGCHGHPRHCHARSEWSTNSSGRHYVAGHFGGGRSRHRRGRRR